MFQTHKTTQNMYKAHKEGRCRDLHSNGMISSCEKSSLAASALSSSHPHPSHTHPPHTLTHPTLPPLPPSPIPHHHPFHTFTHSISSFIPHLHPSHTLRKILAQLQSNPVPETTAQSPDCTS